MDSFQCEYAARNSSNVSTLRFGTLSTEHLNSADVLLQLVLEQFILTGNNIQCRYRITMTSMRLCQAYHHTWLKL